MRARLDVDLSAFAANLRRIRQTVAPARHLLVVKDDAYGHGLEPVVRTAMREGVEWFGTFDVPTAQEVRRVAGPRARIVAWTVYGPEDVDAALSGDIDLGLGSRDGVRMLIERARALGIPGRVHLKIDTGLHRNGIRPEEWVDAVAEATLAEASGALAVAGVWSHLAESSDADDDASRAQFLTAAAAFGRRPVIRHLAASAASFARPEFRFDMVRVGAYAYGIRPAGGPSDDSLGIRSIATLVATVAGVADGMARLDIGSLDGLDSRLAGRMEAGTPCGPRRIRAISETSALVDSWPGAMAGQEVALLGAGAPATATDLAEALGTIGEQVVLRISPRLPRRYL